LTEKVVIIGAGIGGLGAAGIFARKGYGVTVVEKNAMLGGRANIFEVSGFRFDMGPSWYLAPDTSILSASELKITLTSRSFRRRIAFFLEKTRSR